MSQFDQNQPARLSLVKRFTARPRVQKLIQSSKNLMDSTLEKYQRGHSVTRENVIETANEMGKFFSAAEAKSAFEYTSEVAKEINEDFLASKVRLMSSTLRTCFESQVRSLFDKNKFSIESNPDDETEEQD